MEQFGYLFENPRKKRRRSRSRRRKKASRRRRVTVSVAANPTRKKARRRRRRATAVAVAANGRRRRRRNPFPALGGVGGRIGPTFTRAGTLVLGEVVGDLLQRAVLKFTPLGRMPTLSGSVLRIGVGLLGEPLLKMLKAPEAFRRDFAAVNVAAGLLVLTNPMRSATFRAVGLGDDEMADYELAALTTDDSDVSDYEMADYELAGDPPAGVLGDDPPTGVLGYGEQDYG